jgi:M6 family metalloprotease-like protein
MTLTARRPQRKTRQRIGLLLFVLAVLPGMALSGAVAQGAPPARAADHALLQPIDAQDWKLHDDMTWEDDYVNIRPDDWLSPATSQGSDVQYQGAVILLDFVDQPFLITQEAESHPFGNPLEGHEPVAPEDVNDWMAQYLNFPNEYNNQQGIHAYWMENSFGQIGVDLEVFGPYRLVGNYHEYGLSGFGRNVSTSPTATTSVCPSTSETCNRNFTNEGTDLWRADIGCASGNCGYDFRFLVTAGHDETSTWHEFGEMMFETQEDVPAAFGPPGAEDGPVYNHAGVEIPNWANTRYVPWTSWKAASNHWPSAGGGVSRQAENSGLGVYAHEFSHIRGLPDNYGNPYNDSARMPSAHWEMMSRGSFNGPGGVHARWQVPNAGGSSLGPHHMVRFKQMLGIYGPDDQVLLQRDDLLANGPAVATVKARAYVPDGDQVALQVTFGAGGDLAGSCANQGFTGPNGPYPQGSGWCPGTNFNHYTMEVVDRVGNDSFVPGHGVLIAKTKNTGSPRVWVVDANPQDINLVDFYRPVSGEPVMMPIYDPRQLNNATFHAGTDSGSDYEYVDEFNRLHLYVIDTRRDDAGQLYYDLGVRHLDGAGDFDRGVALGNPSTTGQEQGWLATCSFPLTNTGDAGDGLFDSDIYRLSATSSSPQWDVRLPNALAAAEAGETVEVPVHVLRRPPTQGEQSTTVTLTAVSESDPSQSTTSTCDVHVRDTTPASR